MLNDKQLNGESCVVCNFDAGTMVPVYRVASCKSSILFHHESCKVDVDELLASDERLSRIYPPDLEHNFSYHPPQPGQTERYVAIRAKALELAKLIDWECPQSRERAIAMTNLEQAVFWANAAIARKEA